MVTSPTAAPTTPLRQRMQQDMLMRGLMARPAYPRGGIPIDVFWQTGVAPQHVWLPETGVPTYRGRG